MTAGGSETWWDESGTALPAIARNVGTRYMGVATEAIIGLLILPFNLAHLGTSAYGLWMVAASVTAYFSIFDLGYGGALVKFVAQYRARRDYRGLNEIVSTVFVVFAGFGITAPELGYDDYAGIDARGRFVLIFEDEPQEDDPRSVFSGRDMTVYSTSAAKGANAARHGALAVLVASEPNRKHPAYRELSRRRQSATRGGAAPRMSEFMKQLGGLDVQFNRQGMLSERPI